VQKKPDVHHFTNHRDSGIDYDPVFDEPPSWLDQALLGDYRLTFTRHKLRRMGTNELEVPSDQLLQAATQWQGLSAGLTSAAPSPGQPFQLTTAAISAIDAATGVGGAACMARIQDTAAKVTSAAAGYANQDASGQGELAAVAPQVVMV
jgi:hypothetical protein